MKEGKEKFPKRCTQISLPPAGSDDAYYSRAYIQQVSQSEDAKELGLACKKKDEPVGFDSLQITRTFRSLTC